MNPNFILFMPHLPIVMAEDSNAPELRKQRNHEKFRVASPNGKKSAAAEKNERFLRMLTRR